MNDNKEITWAIIDSDELPPLVFTMDEDDQPKVIINNHFRIWLMLHRKLIAGTAKALFGKIDEILTGYLTEQRIYEKMEDYENGKNRDNE
jgi:hypothetical protein